MTIAGPLLAEDQDRPWEPHTFAIGDRVRVKLSPECHCWRVMGHGIHRSANQNKTATIVDFANWTDGEFRDHYIHADFDSYIECEDGYRATGGHFLAIELEPLDPEATR